MNILEQAMTTRGLCAIAAMLAICFTTVSGQSATRDEVMKRGYLQCGVSTGLSGFSRPDGRGNWTGLDVDVCRAVAAAVLADAAKVKYVPLTAKERFISLQAGEIDLLSRNSTWTLARDSSLGLHFAGVSYYDVQGFIVSRKLGVNSALELDGAAVCMQSGTTSELNLADYFEQHSMEYRKVMFDTPEQTMKGFEAGRCNVLSSDLSQLYGLRIQLTNPDDAFVLPEVIAKEPLGPVVRQGDDTWLNIVKWSLFAMVYAEEIGLTSANIDSMKNSSNPVIRRFVGAEGIGGDGLGLAPDWAYQIVRQVGNYGEVFDRNVGSGSPLKIERGLNDLWTRGGLQYAPPFR